MDFATARTPTHAFFAALLLGAPSAASAQDLHVGVGRSDYDLAGTGHVFVASARYSSPLTGALAIEIGGTWFEYEFATYAFPEVSLVLGPRLGSLRPYLAAGAGVTVALQGFGGGRPTLHAAAGLNVRLNPRWGLRSELRVRAVDPWGAVTADITAGPTLRF